MVNKRAVRILLECIRVWHNFCQNLHENEKKIGLRGHPLRIFGSATAITCRNTWAMTKLNAFPIFVINLDPDETLSVANPELPRRGGGHPSHGGRASLLFGKNSCRKLHENGRNLTQ